MIDQAAAAPVQITSSPHDFETSWQTSTATFNSREGGTDADEIRVGGQSGFKFNGIYYFKLPELPAGSAITSAHFATSSVADDSRGGVAPGFNADLWAIGFDNNAYVPDGGSVPGPITHGVPDLTVSNAAAADYHKIDNGPADAGTGARPGVFRSNVRIMDDFLVPGEFVAFEGAARTEETDAASDAALLAYIQSLYANPNFIPGTSHLILRLNPDNTPATDATNRYNVSSQGTALGEFATADAGAIAPTLTLDIQAIPEPGGLALLAMAAAGLLGRRRDA